MILRVKKVRDYTQIDNDLIRNATLSLKAKGLMLWLLSHEDNWEVCIKQIIAQNDDGRGSVRSAIAELIDAGHLVRQDFREEGRFWSEYTVSEKRHRVQKVDTAPLFSDEYTGCKNRHQSRFTASENPTPNKNTNTKNIREPAAPPESVSPKVDVDPILEELPAPLDTPEFREAWEQWKQYRRERKAPLTKSTKEKQLTKLSAWGPARAIVALDWTITNGWQGIFEPKDAAGKPVVSHVAAPQLRQRLDREGEDRRARVAAEAAHAVVVDQLVGSISSVAMPALISEYIAWTGRPNARAPDPATNQPFRQWLFDKFSERKEGAA